MDKDYKEIKLCGGVSVETAVSELLKYKADGKLACCNFNGHMLYSDIVTLDNAYLEITGKTKKEYERLVRSMVSAPCDRGE